MTPAEQGRQAKALAEQYRQHMAAAEAAAKAAAEAARLAAQQQR